MFDWNLVQQELGQRGFLHFGFLCVALAYLLRDVLHLRLLAIVGYFFFVLAAFRRGMPDPVLLGWYAVFVTVNAGHATLLWRERRREHLTADERAMFDLAFSSLALGPARRLMRRGRWRDLPDGFLLTTQGRISPEIWAVLDGEVEVLVDGVAITSATPGQFVGEIGFLAGGPATATARARGPVRALGWERARLERGMKRDGALHDTVHAAFGRDLARKVAEQSLRPRVARAAPAVPPTAPAPADPRRV